MNIKKKKLKNVNKMKEEIKQTLIELHKLAIELQQFNPQESKGVLYAINQIAIKHNINLYE